MRTCVYTTTRGKHYTERAASLQKQHYCQEVLWIFNKFDFYAQLRESWPDNFLSGLKMLPVFSLQTIVETHFVQSTYMICICVCRGQYVTNPAVTWLSMDSAEWLWTGTYSISHLMAFHFWLTECMWLVYFKSHARGEHFRSFLSQVLRVAQLPWTDTDVVVGC